MATGRARGIKRSSTTSSYSSATTIVIFVGLSVLALWLLTSNSFAPPQSNPTTTKTPTRITSIGHPHHNNELPQTHQNLDSSSSSSISDPSKGERSNDDKADETVEIEPETKVENEETQTDGGVKTEPTLTDQVDHQDTKGSEENDVAEEQEKQAALETQTSEESSMTQKEQAEDIREKNPHSETKVETNDPESSRNHGAEKITAESGSLTQSSETTQNQITDEDEQRRIDEHQQQEDEQNQQREREAQSKDPNGATSRDQIQHDEPNAQATNQETKHDDSLGEDTNKVTLSQNGDNSEIPKESTESKKSWSTQANQSENQKERRSNDQESSNHGYTWLLCNETAGADYIPCLDNEKVIAKIHKRSHHQHRERHCPEDPPTCLVPLPHGYKKRIDWPQSRDKIWYNNVPHTSLAEYKGHQNWVKVTGEFLSFPGGGTQFIHGALHYIDFIREAVPDIAWGKHTRVVLDVGCGVASLGGYLFERDVLTMFFAPKDEHEAQVQFALERGIPAISAVMGSQ